MKFKILFLFIVLASNVAVAQTKVGTIDNDFIINIMPEAKIVIEKTQEYGARLDSSFTIKMKDFQARVADFKKNEEEMGELMKKTMLTELSGLERDIKKYQENGNKLMQLKQNELMVPLYKKLNTAIEQVAKENGYTQILVNTGNQFAYIDENFDITELVMNKLGIKLPVVTEE